MKFVKMKRPAAALAAAVLMLSGCGGSEKAALENIFADFETYAAATDCNRALYEQIASAAEEYVRNPNEQTKARFFEVQEENSEKINKNLHIESSLGDEAKSVMLKYDISEADYAVPFDMFEYNSQNLADWEDIITRMEIGDIESLQATLTLKSAEYKCERIVDYYAIMEMFSEVGDNNIKSLREMLAKYPTVVCEDIEWITDRNEIEQRTDESFDDYNAAIDEYKKFINEREIYLLEQQKKAENEANNEANEK